MTEGGSHSESPTEPVRDGRSVRASNRSLRIVDIEGLFVQLCPGGIENAAGYFSPSSFPPRSPGPVCQRARRSRPVVGAAKSGQSLGCWRKKKAYWRASLAEAQQEARNSPGRPLGTSSQALAVIMTSVVLPKRHTRDTTRDGYSPLSARCCFLPPEALPIAEVRCAMVSRGGL